MKPISGDLFAALPNLPGQSKHRPTPHGSGWTSCWNRQSEPHLPGSECCPESIITAANLKGVAYRPILRPSPSLQQKMALTVVDQLSGEQGAAQTKSRVSDRTVIAASHPNPSLQVTADHKLKSVVAPVYAPRWGEVLVHIKATGICGSDLHFWKTGRIGSLVFEGDCIIGHEASGIVLQCGEGVSHLKPGRRQPEI